MISLVLSVLLSASGVRFDVMSKPSPGRDDAWAVVADETGFYVGGIDSRVGDSDFEWRLEKRDLKTGERIYTFGDEGAVRSNPSSGADWSARLAAGAGAIFQFGSEALPEGEPGTRWRIEKRDRLTGVLGARFAEGGVVSEMPARGENRAFTGLVCGAFLFAAGWVGGDGNRNRRRRVEKRDVITGRLDARFGQGGVLTSAFEGWVTALACDSSSVFVLGDEGDPYAEKTAWRIEKRRASDGTLLTPFGQSGVLRIDVTEVNDQSSALVLDKDALFVTGCAFAHRARWHTEKRSPKTGALIAEFGTSGVVESEGSEDGEQATAIALHPSGVYLGGHTWPNHAQAWVVERRDPKTGALLDTFTDPGGSLEGLAPSAQGVFAVGTWGNDWRMLEWAPAVRSK